MVMDGRVPKLVNLAAMNMVRSGGGKRSGTVGLIDLAETRGSLTMAGGTGMAGMDFKMGGQMVTLRVKAISGWKRPQMAMPTALKDFQFRNAEKPDLGVREWKVMGIPLRRTELSTPRCLGFSRAIQIRKRVKL